MIEMATSAIATVQLSPYKNPANVSFMAVVCELGGAAAPPLILERIPSLSPPIPPIRVIQRLAPASAALPAMGWRGATCADRSAARMG